MHTACRCPVGFLFGLGFDTATEVGLLAVTVTTASEPSVSGAYVLLLPLLFAAGMSLLDTLDGILMMKSYAWALREPEKKLNYNL